MAFQCLLKRKHKMVLFLVAVWWLCFPEHVEAIDATLLKQRCCGGAYMASTPRYKGLNNQMNTFVLMATFSALVNSTIIAPAIWSNYMSARDAAADRRHPRRCAVHGEPWLLESYVQADGSCAAVLDWELVYDINAMRAAMWPFACVLTESELSSVCKVKADVGTLPDKGWLKSGCNLITGFFESAEARRRMHELIVRQPHGILKLCVETDCQHARDSGTCRNVVDKLNPRRHDVSRAAWAWYRRIRYSVRLSVNTVSGPHHFDNS